MEVARLEPRRCLLHMRVEEGSPSPHLAHWQRMHESRFFNPNARILTEKDAVESQKFYKVRLVGRKTRSVQSRTLLHNGTSYFDYRPRAAVNELTIVKYIKDECPANLKYEEEQKPEPPRPLKAKPLEREPPPPLPNCPKPVTKRGNCLFRRPNPPKWPYTALTQRYGPSGGILPKTVKNNKIGRTDVPAEVTHSPHDMICVQAPSELHALEDEEESEDDHDRMDDFIEYFDTFRLCSFTTFFDDAPFTNDSYYAIHFPLLMQKIPRCHERLEEAEDLVANAAKVSLSFLNTSSSNETISPRKPALPRQKSLTLMPK